jgi:sortase A
VRTLEPPAETDVVDLTTEERPIAEDRSTPRTSSPTRGRRLAGIAIFGFGALIAAFLLFEFVASDLVYARAQRVLLQDLKVLTDRGAASRLDWSPAPGDPVAMLSIPKLGLQSVVVEGTTSSSTAMGPGHLRGSPLPGRPGNSVIMGRRTTFGSPFAAIDALEPGDSIQVATGAGLFTYAVVDLQVVRPGQLDVLGPANTNRLTLVTSSPPYTATGRLVVIGQLLGRPAGEPLRPETFLSPAELGLQGQSGALGPILLWLEVLAAVGVGGVWLSRRGYPRVAWLLGAPIALALLWATFMAIDRFLPPTL